MQDHSENKEDFKAEAAIMKKLNNKNVLTLMG